MALNSRLTKPAEFQNVYRTGRKFPTFSLVVIAKPNEVGEQRLGITASRKFSKQAVKRNRAKRLIREAFRGSQEAFKALDTGYDWVILPRRSLLTSKVWTPIHDLAEVIKLLTPPPAPSVTDGVGSET